MYRKGRQCIRKGRECIRKGRECRTHRFSLHIKRLNYFQDWVDF